MSDFGEFLLRLGYLDDCTVTLFEWKPRKQNMAFEIEDLYFNFEGLPEYKGQHQAELSWKEFSRLTLRYETSDAL